MRRHSFISWLRNELASASCALLTLYLQRDRLLYVEGPQLEREYMRAVGEQEETVIRAEIESALLRKKQNMLQTAINRREAIDEAAIDAQLELERQAMLKEAAGSAAPGEYAQLTSEQAALLQKLYGEIVRGFHPQAHPQSTEVQRQLFMNAQEAYRRNDLEALRLIHELLQSTLGEALPIELREGEAVQSAAVEASIEDETVDYALAGQIFAAFVPTDAELALREECARYRQSAAQVMQDMARTRAEFPYTAAEMLSSPEKTQAYRDELAHRMFEARAECARREEEIREMLQREAAHG